MIDARRPIERVAILSFHSHGDRSFLDDRDLALLSGDLRAGGVANDLVLVAFGAGEAADALALEQLVERLQAYDAIVFERVWSADLVARVRAALPGTTFIHCRGEHVLADPPADYVCSGEVRQSLPALIDFLRGAAPTPPAGTWVKRGGAWVPVGAPSLARPRARVYAPNLRPILVNPEGFPGSRTFSIQGNVGCPYQADARDNPVYAGAVIPEGLGKGCAFCTTGNLYAGKAPAETSAWVLEQLRYLRAHAPELQRVVLKDQNPFAYLTEVVRTLADERLGPFTLMLETRADWLTRNARRFDEALVAARSAGIRISPFLVGIESFSQPELDRYNKGTTAEANVEFIEKLWEWRERHGDTLDLESASFGFVLFSPWTTLDDLETNLRAIQRTRFDKLRGRVLLSRARLYPDTALYYLAVRDGLLIDAYREGEDSSRRYGYYPAHPWRFQREEVAHFAELATELVTLTGGRDEVRIFAGLVGAFRGANDHRPITAPRVLEAMAASNPGRRSARASPPAGARSFPMPRCEGCGGYDACARAGVVEPEYPRCRTPLRGVDAGRMTELFARLARAGATDAVAVAALHRTVLARFREDRGAYPDVLEPSFSCDAGGAHIHRFSYAFPGFRADPAGVSATLLELCRPFGAPVEAACRAMLRAAQSRAVEQPSFGFADDGGGRFRVQLYLQLRAQAAAAALDLAGRIVGRRLDSLAAAGSLRLLCLDLGARGLAGAKLYFLRERLRVDTAELGPVPLLAALAELGVTELRDVLTIHRIAGPDDDGASRPVEVDFSLPDNELGWRDVRQLGPVRALLEKSPEIASLEESFRLAVRRVSGSIGLGDELSVYYGLAEREAPGAALGRQGPQAPRDPA